MDLFGLADSLETVVAEIVDVEGFLFVNYRGLSLGALSAEIASDSPPAEAQRCC